MTISVTNTKSPITVVDDKVTVKVSSGVGPQGPTGPAGGVASLNGATGGLTLAAIGASWGVAGTTITLTVSPGVSSWNDLTGKPFATLGSGLSVVAGVLSATGLSIADTTGLQTALELKAPLASPTFTGTVGGLAKTMVGLAAVDNTADASKPVSTAQAAADAVVQAHAIQRANHTGTQAVGTITGLGSLATQNGTFTGTSSGTNSGDQTASTVSVAGGYVTFAAVPATVEGALAGIDGALDNKADSAPATAVELGQISVGAGLAVTLGGAVSVSYGTTSATACQGNDARLSDSRAPSGAAGGDLTGTFPSPTIAAGAVTLAKTTGLQKTITVSSSEPTGGVDGDIHLRYSA